MVGLWLRVRFEGVFEWALEWRGVARKGLGYWRGHTAKAGFAGAGRWLLAVYFLRRGLVGDVFESRMRWDFRSEMAVSCIVQRNVRVASVGSHVCQCVRGKVGSVG